MGNKDSIPANKHRNVSGDNANIHGAPSGSSMYGPATFGGPARSSATTPPPPVGHHTRHLSESADPGPISTQPFTTSQPTTPSAPIGTPHAHAATTPSGNHLAVSLTSSVASSAGAPPSKLFMQPVADGDIEFDPEKFGQKGAGDIPRFRTSTISEGTRIDNKKLPSVFKWDGHNVREVYLVGSFNNWKAKIPLRKSQDVFYTIVDLPEGDHEYKFLVDGQWKHDEAQPHRPNNYGSHNNTISVKKTDFEVLEALAIDSHNSGSTSTATAAAPGRLPSANSQTSLTPLPPSSCFSSPYGGNFDRPEEFHQRVPPKLSLEKGNPPTLPPHLLQVILNKETSEEYDPSLLPEPNHVMLNHLYALSIKDNVLVLSATHRYRKRFVTTLFYKPINS